MNDDYRDPRKDPRPDDVLLIKGIATQVIDADPDDGVEAHDITGQELDLSLSDWQDFAARSVVLWQDDAPPPADVALLRAERDKLLTILGFDGPYAVLDVLQILADAADHLLSAHSCDRHGWETVDAAADSARRIVESVNDARADAPPPANPSLLALANRTLTADLEAARAEVESLEDDLGSVMDDLGRALAQVDEARAERDEARTIADRNINFRAKLWEALGGHVASDPLEPLSEGAARVRRERDEARAEVARLTRELDGALGEVQRTVAIAGKALAERDEARSHAARLTRILAVERGGASNG